jgi:phosphate-selective porin OprO/OprP
MTKLLSLTGAGIAVALSVAIAGTARADDAADKVQLEQRVRDLERELSEVKSSLRGGYFTANSDLEARVGELERLAADNSMSTMFKTGLKHEGGDGAFKYQFFGLLQNDWYWFWNDGEDYDDADEFNPGVDFRRIRLGANGTMYGNVKWHSEIELSNSDVQLADVWLELAGCTFGNVRVGHQKEPIGFDQLTSDRYVQFSERSFVNSLTPGRNTGVMLHGRLMDDMLLYQVGMFRDANAVGDDNGNAQAGEYNFTGRVSGRPMIEDDGTTWLHAGVSGRYEDVADESFSRGVRSAIWQTGTFSLSAESDLAWQAGAELAYTTGPWTFLGEFMYLAADFEDTDDEENITAWSLEGAYWLTGENTAYDKEKGTFGRTSPKHNFGDGDGTGAWQLALRYDHIEWDDDFDVGVVTSAEAITQWTAGVKWWLNPNTAIHLNVARIKPETYDALYPIGVRFEIDF